MRTILRTVLACLCLYLTAPAHSAPVKMEIAAGEASKALDAFGKLTGLQMFFEHRTVEGRRTRAVSGKLEPAAALALMLEESGLTFEFINEHTVAIRAKKPGEKNSSSRLAPADQMRLAVAEPEGKEDKVGNKEADAQQVVVEGQRERPAPFSTGNLDLTRTEDDVLPFQVFDAKDIELSGAMHLQDFLQNRLPQNFSDVIVDEGRGDGFDYLSGNVDLRGWGAAETVFLLNGRRMPAHYQSTTGDTDNAAPSLLGIPLASIERIEILSSAGSAIYGANATGGVINIVMRRDFKGGQLAVNYETPSDTHAPRRRADLNYGLPLPAGLSLRLGVSYSGSEPLRAADRAAVSIERWRRLLMERDPTRLISRVNGNPYLTSTNRYGATPNIRATSTTGNLFSGLPGAQASNFTTVPNGSTGSAPLSAYQPGVYSLELSEGAAGSALYAKDSTLGTPNTSIVLSLGVDGKLSDRWRWSLDARYTEIESEGRPGAANMFSVPGNAPSNPFGQTVTVSMVDPNLNRPELLNRPQNLSWDVSFTLQGRLGRWHGFLDGSYTHHRHLSRDYSFWEPDGGWTAAFLSGAYNPFVDVRVSAPAAPDFYENYVARRLFTTSATRSYQSALKASGPLFSLPAGAVELTAGVSGLRSDRYRSEIFGQYQDGLTWQPKIPSGSTSDVASSSIDPRRLFVFDSYAGYAEVVVPLLSSGQNLPLIERLELFGSGRLDHMIRNGFRQQSTADRLAGLPPEPVRYSNTSSLYTYGLRHGISQDLTLRVSQSIGFKPPSIAQITPPDGPPTTSRSGVNDPLRPDWDGVLTPEMYISGGNPDLKPETTRSANFGVIFTPRWAPGLRISVDYLESTREDAISTLSPQELVMLESEFPGKLQRAAPDGHPSGVGLIIFMDLTPINMRRVSSRSMDISLEHRLEEVLGGRLVLAAAVTRNISFKVQINSAGEMREQVRNPSGAFSQWIEWNGNAQLRWEGPQWSVGWSTRYFDYIPVTESLYVAQGSDRVPWAFNHDLNVNFRAPSAQNPRGAQWWLSGTSITFGVKNIFDRAPRFWAQGTEKGTVSFDSLMGRSIWLGVRKDFGS